MGVAVGGLHLHDPFAHFENRNVEGAAAEVVDGNRLVLFLVQAVGERGGRGLVHDAHDLEPCNLACVLGRLPLRIVEVGGHRDHRLRHRLPEVLLGRLLELLEDHAGDFRRGVLFAARTDPGVGVGRPHDLVGHHLHLFADFVVLAAHEPLDGEDRVFWIGDCLALGDLAHKPLAGFREGDNRRRKPPALWIGDHDRLAALHDGDNRVCGAEIDADDLAHYVDSFGDAAMLDM